MFTVRTVEAYLDKIEVFGEDRTIILGRAQSLARDDGVLMSTDLPNIFDGYPALGSGLNQDMFNQLLFDDPSLIEPLREH